MNRRTSIGKNILRMKLRLNWLLEDIYDNICSNYNFTNAGWYPSAKHEVMSMPSIVISEGVTCTIKANNTWEFTQTNEHELKLINDLIKCRIDPELVVRGLRD